MNATIRGMKGHLALCALAGLGLALRWVTAGTTSSAGSAGSATAEDLTALASLAIAAVAWVAYAWLLIAVLATVLEQVPGAVGRSASAVASRITSQGSRALLRSALGVAAVTPLTIGVAHATPGAPGPQRAWTAVEPASTIQFAGDSPHSPGISPQFPGMSPADWRATEKASSLRLTEHSTRTTPPGQERVAVPKRPQDTLPADRVGVPKKPQDNLPAGRVGVPDRPTEGAPTRYTDLQTGRAIRPAAEVVRPGDSLWALAAAELGRGASDAAVAERWPQWYAANRRVIGPDPDLILPGQVLRTPAPAATQPAPSTHANQPAPSSDADQPVPPTHQEK